MEQSIADLKQRLANSALAVCRHYLSKGRRQGRYWLVGDVDNSPGRSLYVRLNGPEDGRGSAGKWTDAATGEHGDLLDLIAASQRLSDFREVLAEARRFLSSPDPVVDPAPQPAPKAPTGSLEAARRLWAASRPITGTLVETYLRHRGITDLRGLTAVRFHPRCFYRGEPGEALDRGAWPALIARVTSGDGQLTGLHRTWLAPDGGDKAPVFTPRRAMGDLLGHAVRFGSLEPTAAQAGVLAAGEGIETLVSLRAVSPTLPLAAALSAAHLAALALPDGLRRLYLVQDNDDAGRNAVAALAQRAMTAGIEPLTLTPTLGDFNDDLQRLGAPALAAALRVQLAPEDVVRFWRAPTEADRAA